MIFEIREVSFGGRQMSCELKKGVIREDICMCELRGKRGEL